MSIPTISDIAGIITQPEIRFTSGGKAILSVRLAFNDSKYDPQTQKWETTKTFYVDGQAWEQTAERLAEQLNQGDQVYVAGRLETQSWEDKDGGKRSKPVLNIHAARKLAKAEPAGSSRPASNSDQWGGNQPAQSDPWASQGNSQGWGTDSGSAPF